MACVQVARQSPSEHRGVTVDQSTRRDDREKENSEAIERFSWESVDQKKGYLALVQYLRANGFKVYLSSLIGLVSAWFIQKAHESNQWWRDTVSGQISPLVDEISMLKRRNAKLEDDMKEVKQVITNIQRSMKF